MAAPFTKENAAEYGRRGAIARAAKYTPEQRSAIARKAANRRWYKFTDSDVDRVDRHLRVLSGIVGLGLSTEDFILVIRAITAMAPFERMKIALNAGLVNVTPGQQPMIEGQSQIESKLQLASERRRRAFIQADREEAVETTSTKVEE